MPRTAHRVERDLLGERNVPATAYYGIHTLRALENFPISGTSIALHGDLITALACVKQACAISNHKLGFLDRSRARAIIAACEEIRAGKLRAEFVVDVIQGGAGTSTNMNANEVIANRALEHLGRRRGEYEYLHPLEHVNLSQSTNDVYPTAVCLGLHFAIDGLLEAMALLQRAFNGKARAFVKVIKLGRTQLQDAVPMTLGQEFSTYAVMLGEDRMRLREASRLIEEINLGATAIGTGINTVPGYARLVRRELTRISGVKLITAPNLVEATQDAGAFVQLSGVLKRIAVKLSKVCNDLRLLSSGPMAGFNEINLPPMQAGSSIMPGKVNPVIPEVVNQIAFEVIGHDVTVSFAAEGGQLQLNAFEPIIAHSLFTSVSHLRRGCVVLAERCVKGITANQKHLARMVKDSPSIATALNPYIGYEKATYIAKKATTTGQSVYDLVVNEGLLSRKEVDKILRPEVLTQPQPRRATSMRRRSTKRPNAR